MPNAGTAEIYFIAAMMILIMIISVAAVYFFFRQYNLEKGKNSKSLPKRPKLKSEDQTENNYVEK